MCRLSITIRSTSTTAHFEKKYQERGTASDPGGAWNPGGDGVWRLLGCRVTAAWRGDGTAVAADDPVLQCLIADSDRKVAGKLVDLDSEQQLVSEVWGLEVRICTADGTTLMRGKFEPAAFVEIWDRATGGGGDVGGGTMYQSVVSALEWADVSGSLFLQELRQRAQSGLLSIKFNVDGYNLNLQSPEFTRGRIVGTIGPASVDEPHHFVRGRQFMTTGLPRANFFAPVGKINFCTAFVDAAAGKITLDVGNALPTVKPGGDMADVGALTLGCNVVNSDGSQTTMAIDGIPYTDAGWYERTAGVVVLPAARRLSDQEVQAALQNPLVLRLADSSGNSVPATTESPGGFYVRADRFVCRLDAGETAEARLIATRFGQPYAGARIVSILDPNGLQPFSLIGAAPPVATPADAIDFPARIVTGKDGIAVLPIVTSNPGNPRVFIDGQIYGIRSALEETLAPAAGFPFNPWHFISLHVFDAFEADEPPTWHGSIEPIFQQAANLYPVMQRILDMGSYESVIANRKLLILAFGIDISDPNSMPVTRDLSMAKRKVLLRWLADDPPQRGKLPAVATRSATPFPASQAAPASLPVAPTIGSKATAASQRLGLRRYSR